MTRTDDNRTLAERLATMVAAAACVGVAVVVLLLIFLI